MGSVQKEYCNDHGIKFEFEDVIKMDDRSFARLRATVVFNWGYLVTDVYNFFGDTFTAQDAMEDIMNTYPDAIEIKIHDLNARPKTEFSRYPWKVEGSSNPWI